MKKRTKRLVSALALALAAFMLASCAGGGNTATTAAETTTAAATTAAAASDTHSPDVPEYMYETGFPIAKEKTTFSVYIKKDEADGRWEDLEVMNWLEEITNVHLEYEYVASEEEYKNNLNLMFAGNTYPDILMPRGGVTWKEDEVYGKDGFVINMEPLIERWMPNCRQVLEIFPQLKAGQTSASGNMYGLPFLYEGRGGNPHLWYMEPYWMRAAGWDDVPNTVDEMRTFMYDIKAVLDSGNYERPEDEMYVLGCSPSATFDGTSTMANVMMTAYTGAICGPTFPWGAPDMKNIQFLVDHPGYKETVQFFADLYRDGLIDPEIFTYDAATFNARKSACKYAMYTGSSSSLDPELIRDTPPANPGEGYACMAIRPMTSQYNDRRLVNFETAGSVDWSMITDKCAQPEIMARWFDIFYDMNHDIKDNTTPHPMMFYKGYYGQHWSFTDETEKFWTFLPSRTDGKTNDDGTPAIIDWDYSRAYICPGWSLPCGYYLDGAFSLGSEMYVGKQITTSANVYPYCTTDTQLNENLARMTQEEFDSVATQLTELQRYLGEQWGLFMSGQKSVDRDWDAFVSECYRLGAKEITDVYQAVYERWNAALK